MGSDKLFRFNRRADRVRNRLKSERSKFERSFSGVSLRLSVFRSNKFFYAQLIDDLAGNTLCSISSNAGVDKSDQSKSQDVKLQGNKSPRSKQFVDKSGAASVVNDAITMNSKECTYKLGVEFAPKIQSVVDDVAKKLPEGQRCKVVLDRGGYKYHGKIAHFVDALRAGGVAI